MDPFDRIQSFLAAARTVLRRHAATRAALYCGAALLALALVVPLAALLVDAHHGALIGWVGSAAAGVAVVISLAVGFIAPLRRWHSPLRVARRVGQKHPDVASDLLSAVELGQVGPDRAAQQGHVSADLVRALIAQTAARVGHIDPRSLVPPAPARTPATLVSSLLVAHLAVLLLAPSTLLSGWNQVLEPQDPRPFGGADVSAAPLVGDMRVTLDFPDYSQRATAVLPLSSGDFRAIPGTSVTIETKALVPVASARILLDKKSTPGGDARGSGDARSEVPVERVGKRLLRARFPVYAPGQYRFLIESPGGSRRVESHTRRIEIDADQVPEVQLYTPGEELDVTSMKRIELAYIAEDDYGIAKVELVWDEDGKPRRKALPLSAPGRRSAQGKFVWDLAEVSLEPGVKVAYHLEVTDNDTVLGPNVGRSRSFRLRVFSPREKHEQLIARQRELFENMLRSLGGRLTVAQEDVRAHTVLQRQSAELVVDLGTLLTALKADELADDALREALKEMRGRIDELAKGEAALLEDAVGKPPSARLVARLGDSDQRMIAELEKDALVLADWIERQQMENVLALSDEVEVHKDRLKQLFKEYERTGSQELLAEIEREMRALEKRLAEMAMKRGEMAEDVLDRFVNSEAIQEQEVESCMGQVRELMDAGRVAEAQRTLETCMNTLEQANQAMEQALRALRGDKFSEQERKFGEMMDKLADLTQDQRELAAAADDIWNRYAARAAEMMREEAKETRKRASEILERLREQLARVPEAGLTPFAKEELEIVGARLDDVDAMLDDGDIAEAMAMAKLARGSLETTAAELEAAMEDEQDEPWIDSTQGARREVGRAERLADKLVSELEASTPSPGEIMSPGDKRRLARLRRRQRAAGERARRLAERARQMGADLPGSAGEAISQGVDGARNHMQRAGERMGAQDPSGARQETRGAADALEQAMGAARDAARNRQAAGRAGLREEPIRIPGSDEYKAPEEFREDILEAMKREGAPKGFGDLVKRYYEELIR